MLLKNQEVMAINGTIFVSVCQGSLIATGLFSLHISCASIIAPEGRCPNAGKSSYRTVWTGSSAEAGWVVKYADDP